MARKLGRGFYRRGSVIWVRTDPLTRKPRSTGCRSPRAAELWRARREELAADPAYAASLSASVGKWVQVTIAQKKERGKADGTVRMYEVKLGHVVRIFGASSPLAAITAPTIDAYVSQRSGEGAKNNTIARELTCLRQMLRLAKRAGVYSPGIADVMPVGFSADYQPVKRVLPLAGLAVLLEALPEERRAWVCLALSTGADLSDIERAQPEDYDPERRVMLLRGTKNPRRHAEVPIPEMFAELFEYAVERLPVSWSRVSKDLPELTTRLGLGHITPKDLRRTAATWLIEAGADEHDVSRFLRHRDTNMVRRIYGQVRPEAVGERIDVATKTLQSARPLGGTGRRRGFKSPGDDRADRESPALPGVGGRVPARAGAPGRTETLQLTRARLRLESEVDPEKSRPGLAVLRALDAAYEQDEETAAVALADLADAVGAA